MTIVPQVYRDGKPIVSSFGRVVPEMLPHFWPQIEAIFREKGEFLGSMFPPGSDLVRLACLDGTYDVWCGLDRDREVELAAFCCWESYPVDRFYHIAWVGGKNLRKHLPEALKCLEEYCFGNGGGEVVGTGRPGWERLVRPFGYSQTTVQMRKNVRRGKGH